MGFSIVIKHEKSKGIKGMKSMPMDDEEIEGEPPIEGKDEVESPSDKKKLMGFKLMAMKKKKGK